uniref:GG20421 n=1 Tax=Drosophila erecta TaxID=7220 RepID=B3P3T4_DROER
MPKEPPPGRSHLGSDRSGVPRGSSSLLAFPILIPIAFPTPSPNSWFPSHPIPPDPDPDPATIIRLSSARKISAWR